MKSQKTTSTKKSQKGFTIVELLIAMSVFAVIMLIVVSVFIQVSKMYTKGVTVSRTQEAARNIMDDLVREIQFSNSAVVRVPAGPHLRGTGGYNLYCIGSNRYTFYLDVLQTSNPGAGQSKHVLQKDTFSNSGGCPLPLGIGGEGDVPNATEMMTDNTALTDLDISCTASNTCQIKVRVVYGDPTDDTLFMDEGTPTRRVCRAGIVGAEFCSVVELSTTVTRRLR